MLDEQDDRLEGSMCNQVDFTVAFHHSVGLIHLDLRAPKTPLKYLV
jgi:hypothetical protein